jgi:hypothetical protein
MKKIIYLLTAILFYNAASAQVKVQVQKPITSNKPVFDKNYKVLSVTDTDWEQKASLTIKGNPFKCELWITTDGTLHCKTDAVISKTEVFFLKPTTSSAKNEKGVSTGVGGGYGVQGKFTKAAGSDEYAWGITEKKYNKLHAITLTAYNDKGQKGVFNLINKKVPEKIQE